MTRQDVEQIMPRTTRWPWREALVWLAVAGAALITYASLVPWAYLQIAQLHPNPVIPLISRESVTSRAAFSSLLVVFGERGAQLGRYIDMLSRVFTPAGFLLALGLAFWRRSRIAGFAYIAWLVVMTLGAALVVYAIFGQAPQAMCQINCQSIAIRERSPASGLWLTLAALALLWIAAGVRIASWRAGPADARQVTLVGVIRSLRSPAGIGALVYTVGALVWLFGLIFTPWATQGCAGFPVSWSHFVSGSCTGMDAYDAMVFANPRYALALIDFTGLIGLVAVIAVWQRGWIAPVAATAWAALASWTMFQALIGLPDLLKNHPQLSVSSAPWVAGAGPLVTELGVLALWAGVVTLWWSAIVARRPGWSARQAVQREATPAR